MTTDVCSMILDDYHNSGMDEDSCDTIDTPLCSVFTEECDGRVTRSK